MAYNTSDVSSAEQKFPNLEEEEAVGGAEIATRLGYTQQLQEKFGLISMIGLSCTIMITWEGELFVYQYGLNDSGPLGSIIGYIFCWIGYTLVALCLGELNSIYPTAGGQYRKFRRLLNLTSNHQDCGD